MKYNNIHKGIFIERPNRFIALVELYGKIEKVHVRNTGRCKELLIENAIVYLEFSDNKNRKTQYSLIAVEKGNKLINMDSQAPNKIWFEALSNNLIKIQNIDNIILIKKEATIGSSRLDFYLETKNKKIYMEVKGVTLESANVAKFPDAPTERGVKHVHELIKLKKLGYDCYIIFIIQMDYTKHFEPNYETHKEFATALIDAENEGVNILAFDCFVSPDEIKIKNNIPIKLTTVSCK